MQGCAGGSLLAALSLPCPETQLTPGSLWSTDCAQHGAPGELVCPACEHLLELFPFGFLGDVMCVLWLVRSGGLGPRDCNYWA